MLDLKKIFPEQVTTSCLINGVYYRAQDVKPQGVFVALKGSKSDGHQYIETAFARGAVAVVVERQNPAVAGLQIVVPDTYAALSFLSAQLYPFVRPLVFVGVTGTDGKTSTSVFVQQLFAKLGKDAGYIGTNGVVYQSVQRDFVGTTPMAADLFPLLAQMSQAGVELVTLEVSSHALATKRVADIVFDYAVFTNFSRDHLDFHRTIQAYKAAKLLLFQQIRDTGAAVVNIDDSLAAAVVEATGDRRVLTYSLVDASADFYATDIVYLPSGMRFVVQHRAERVVMQTALLGRFNIYNILVGIAIAVDSGYPLAAVAAQIREIPPIPGRMELFFHPLRQFSVIVDFGHAPNALRNVLRVARELATRKTTLVTGAVGDGDKEKRPLMGAVAIEEADTVIFTTDQPYSEDPAAIIDDMIKHLPRDAYRVILDREAAVQTALDEAQAGDVIVVMGKGRENEIQYKDHVVAFNDYEFVKKYVSS